MAPRSPAAAAGQRRWNVSQAGAVPDGGGEAWVHSTQPTLLGTRRRLGPRDQQAPETGARDSVAERGRAPPHPTPPVRDKGEVATRDQALRSRESGHPGLGKTWGGGG